MGDPLSRPDIRLAAIDLDGTLLRDDKTVSAVTVQALRDWEASGRHFVIVTARPPRSIRYLREEIGSTGIAICANGALLYDFAADAMTPRRCLDDYLVIDMIKRIRNSIASVALALEFGMYFACDINFPDDHSRDGEQSVGDVLNLIDRPVAKLIAHSPEIDIETLYELCVDLIGEDATATHSGDDYLEISAKGINKGSALAEFCNELRISADEVIAMGDAVNDVPMLQWAGTSIAMAGAHLRVREAADHVTASNEDDGVAIVLNRLMIT